MICHLSLHQPDFGILRPFILTFLHVICVPVDLMHVYTPIHTWLSSIPLEQFSLFPSSVWTHPMSHGQRFWWTSFLNWSAGFHFWKTGDIVHYDGYLVFTRECDRINLVIFFSIHKSLHIICGCMLNDASSY